MPNKIICIGGANIDFKLKSPNPLVLNTSNPIHSTISFGGVARNVAHNLAQLTSDIYLQCLVGNDANGLALLTHVQSLGVNTQYSKIIDGQSTSQYYAILNNQGELFIGLADMDIYNVIDDEFITSSWDDWNSQSLIFLDTNLPSSHIDLILKKANSVGAKLCIDPVSVEKAKRIPAQFGSIYLLKPDRKEASTLTGITIESIDDCIRAGKLLKDRGVQNVVITLGQLGYVLVNNSEQVYVAAEEVKQSIDVSGAGDAFVAGILYGIQLEKNIAEACQIGAKAAAQTIQTLQTVIKNP
ncbi:carbohydrate kinase family protein [Legionella waltersii]|uniref:Carbohydrate kinase, pfkB family n=1 Tax=Legionella waltersii TaxID=66969 RepID=A0A0W1ADL3_9GAMM|nr:carbohydrate kinase family protein [Legionella waltersii]KTD79430.1 carbohydrate kinase, pfkB family [Legionella waltersii]SNU97694.1 carbohydrate kinase, pfkB family [Legionella waltersii]